MQILKEVKDFVIIFYLQKRTSYENVQKHHNTVAPMVKEGAEFSDLTETLNMCICTKIIIKCVSLEADLGSTLQVKAPWILWTTGESPRYFDQLVVSKKNPWGLCLEGAIPNSKI